MHIVYLNGKNFLNIQEIHDFLAKELDFPSYYGKNLSALHDVLGDIIEDTRIIVDLTSVKNEDFRKTLLCMVQVIADASEDNPSLEIECLE